MSSRHHIEDFMRGELFKDRRKGEKLNVARELGIAHSVVSRLVGSHLKLLECVVDGTGKVVLEVRRLQKTDISSYQQKEQAHHSSAGGKSVSCCLRKADLPKNCCQTFEGREDYTHADLLCASH
ncbi:hypothetical protein TNCV_363311 [Trichonephila clavipes]|nr:hypothetical protein TNCV_363311 [Trichonephila clavipes]